MKKIVSFIIITILLLSLSITVFAGSVPEDLLSYDEAHIFFGEVLAYSDGSVTVCPVKKIKGDVLTGTQQHYGKPYPVGNFKVKPGNVYLFTYFDENNETNIFEVTSYDTETLKIKNADFDIWKRFEKYLNDGEYEKAEQQRINRLNVALTEVGDEISLSALLEVEKPDCDKVEFALFGKQEKYEIDKEKFFKLAEEIYLTDVTNTLAFSENSFAIYAYDDEKIYTVNMWDNCRVSGSRTGMYSAPICDYIIKAEDYSKLTELFPKEAQPKLPPLKSLYANFVYWFIYNSTTVYIIGALIVVLLIGIIGFAAGYKIRKKKSKG